MSPRRTPPLRTGPRRTPLLRESPLRTPLLRGGAHGTPPLQAGARRTPLLGACLALATALAAPAARAEDDAAKKREMVTNFFDAGAEAFKAGKYLAAAEAFEKAYAILPNPPLLFSAAQAYRRQYLVEPSADTLGRALSLYRQYLHADPKANRREDAMEALAVLVPLETRGRPPATSAGTGEGGSPGGGAPGDGAGDGAPQGGSPDGGQAAPAAPKPAGDPKKTARILITASADGAEVSLDGGPFQPAPLVASVEPVAHRARVRAPGHDEAEVTVSAVAGEQVPQHVTLRPKPGRLAITGTSGARVSVDGKALGALPAAAPLAVEPGSRFVTVTLNGHAPWSRRVEVGRDETVPLDADLAWTQQRKIAWATMSLGAAGLISGAVLGGLALDRQSAALALRDQQASAPLSAGQRDAFNLAVGERNDLGQAAGITFAASALVLATGIGLYAFDEPAAVTPSEAPGTPAPRAPRATFEVGLGSASVRFTF